MKFLQLAILIFVIALCGSVSAQTTVCSGDSVVLVLTTRTGGSALWQQSSDRTVWSPASGTSYNDSLVITAGTSLYYRAKVTDGTCDPWYSDTVLVTIKPAPSPPVATNATSVDMLSFEANWTASAGATIYYLDVATDASFTSFVSGYNNLRVNDTTRSVTGVVCDTTYYYRVRVRDNTCNTTSTSSNVIAVTTVACPVECTYKRTACSGDITDARDNQTYKTVQIGKQCWMSQNLNVGKQIDGINRQTKADTGIEKYCYGDDANNCEAYGGLYLWTEMMSYGPSVDGDGKGPQGICPTGWHIPTDKEYTCLENTLGGVTVAAGKLKKATGWYYNGGSTNSSGFSALPGGGRGTNGVFDAQSYSAFFWSATERNATLAWYRYLYFSSTQIFRLGYSKADFGFSVRCAKD